LHWKVLWQKLILFPVWAFVGSDDTIVNPNSSVAAVTMINNLGGYAKITVFDGATHFDVPELTYKDSTASILQWMTLH